MRPYSPLSFDKNVDIKMVLAVSVSIKMITNKVEMFFFLIQLWLNVWRSIGDTIDNYYIQTGNAEAIHGPAQKTSVLLPMTPANPERSNGEHEEYCAQRSYRESLQKDVECGFYQITGNHDNQSQGRTKGYRRCGPFIGKGIIFNGDHFNVELKPTYMRVSSDKDLYKAVGKAWWVPQCFYFKYS